MGSIWPGQRTGEPRGNTTARTYPLLLAMVGAAAALLFAAAATRAIAGPEVVQARLGFPKGTIVVVNSERRLYLVTGSGKAISYRVAVGTKDEIWEGRTFVSAKRVDPWWYPVDGEEPVPGGDPQNPLGKRALYLDWSLLRIHGTPKRNSIGRAASAGCIRMLDEDVIDLYDRVHIGAPVVVADDRSGLERFRTDTTITGKLEDEE